MKIKNIAKKILPLLLCFGILISLVKIPMNAMAMSGSSGNLAFGKVNNDAVGSPVDGINYGMNAVDGRMDTRWAMPTAAKSGTLTIDLGVSLMGIKTQFSNVIMSDYNNSVSAFSIEYYNGTSWAYAFKGGTSIGIDKAVSFDTVSGTKIRLNITTLGGGGISEFEVYNGTANKATITVSSATSGTSPKYIGYSSGGNLNSTTNNIGWMKYSEANTMRVWYSPPSFVTADNITNDPANISTVSNFDERKALFRANPDSETYYNWTNIDSRMETSGIKENLATYNKLGITALTSISYANFSIAGTWQEYWDCWKYTYGFAYYVAKNYDVNVFQSYNEPEFEVPSNFTITTFIKYLQVQSDAVRCAIADVNKLYSKNLVAKYVGPVVYKVDGANTISAPVMMANRTDYHGNAINYNIIDWYDRHRYTMDHHDTANLLNVENSMMETNTPNKMKLPITLSEWNWNTTSRWQTPEYNIYTGDSPIAFSTVGGTLATIANKIYATYLFKHWQTFYGTSNRIMYAWGRDRDETKNIAKGKPTTVSSFMSGYDGSKVVDGDIRDESAWKTPSNAIGPQTLEIDLQSSYTIKYACVDLGKLGGNGNIFTPNNFSLQYWNGSDWVNLIVYSRPAVTSGGNAAASFLSVTLDPPITTNKIRGLSTDSGTIIIRDIFLSPDKYNHYIGGPMKNMEVNRMFATGFKNERTLLTTTTTDPLMHTNTSYDPETNNYYLWISQPDDTVNDLYTTINLSGLDVCKDTQVTVREVSEEYFGDVPYIVSIDENKSLKVNSPKQSALLLTIPRGQTTLKTKDLTVVEDTMVSIGTNGNMNFKSNPLGNWYVRNSTTIKNNNYLTYLKFNTSDISTSNIQRAVLEVRGWKVSNTPTTPFIIYAFGLDTDTWGISSLTGNSAPNLNKNSAFIEGGGTNAWPIGILSFMGASDYSRVDITDYVKNHPNSTVTIVLTKDRRTEQEVFDNDYVNINTSKDADANNRPKLKLWYTESNLPYTLTNINVGNGNITVDLKNNTTDAKTVNVIYAVYQQKKLVGIGTVPQSMAASEAKSLSCPIPNQGKAWDKAKVFVFENNLTTIKALAQNLVFVNSIQ